MIERLTRWGVRRVVAVAGVSGTAVLAAVTWSKITAWWAVAMDAIGAWWDAVVDWFDRPLDISHLLAGAGVVLAPLCILLFILIALGD